MEGTSIAKYYALSGNSLSPGSNSLLRNRAGARGSID
jgi:hypothetical protein